MDEARQLLSAALDPGGHICIVGLRPKHPPIQTFFSPGDFDAALQEAKNLCDRGLNSYFATSTLKSDDNRKADNVHAVKVLKLDMDVGEDKGYATKRAAVEALTEFCETLHLPLPTMVDSGNGVHVYWILDEALPAAPAKIAAEKLKTLCNEHGLRTDTTTTSDLARVLRVPGTLNLKNPEKPKKVVLRSTVDIHSKDEILATLETAYSKIAQEKHKKNREADAMFAIPSHLVGVELDDATRSLVAGKPKKFSIILERSNKGTGCAQIKDIYDNRAHMEEPRWRAGLSIARFCEDGEEAIQTISMDYPDYDPVATARKAEKVVGPYTCATFSHNWPAICKGCKMKVTSPIQLGEYTPKADASDNLVFAKNKTVDSEETVYEIPNYPFPYFRGKNGGVYLPNHESEEAGDIQICDRDFFMERRLRSETDGYMVQCKYFHPKDGVIDFIFPTSHIGSTEKLMNVLNTNGMLIYEKELYQMRHYIRTWFDSLSNKEEVAMVKIQFGWTEGFKSFVVGDREYTPHKTTKYSPSAPSIAPITKLFSSKGTMLDWRKVIDVYAMPGNEALAMSFLTGFAAPLVPFTGLSGIQINFVSEESGIGKSTSQEACMSIWGDPRATMLSYKDTSAAVLHRMGIYNNLPVCIDEATDAPFERIQSFALAASQGRGSNRMNGSTNSERVNTTTWATACNSSSNKSMFELLQANKLGSQGEVYRIIEITVPPTSPLSKIEADRIFPHLKDNFGLAGDFYAKHLVSNVDAIKRCLAIEHEALDRAGEFVGRERFWSAGIAVYYVGGIIARELGLHNIDMDHMRNWMLEQVKKMRSGITFGGSAVINAQESDDNILAEFLSANIRNTLILDASVDLRTNLSPAPIQVPVGQLVVRYEVNNKSLFIAMREFRNFCLERNIHLDAFLQRQKDAGVYVRQLTKRMTSGTHLPAYGARVFEFKVTDGFSDVLIDSEIED